MAGMSNDKSIEGKRFTEMTEWLKTPLGQTLLESESSLLEHLINRRFGYHLLQLGCADIALYGDSPIGHKFCLRPSAEGKHCGLVAQPEAIPLASDSVDLVLLHHALDYSLEPHQLLREAARVLIAGGNMVIIGFNPYSTWGIRQKLSKGKNKSPWTADLLSSGRLCDWLKLLEFKVEQTHYGLYSLPINNAALIRYSSFMGKLAQQLNWPSGGIYVISAKKQVLPLTPIREPWKALPRTAKGLVIGDNAGVAPNQSHKKTLH